MSTDATDTLELIPREVRDKLDMIRVKLHLRDWQQLTLQQRQQLRDESRTALHAPEHFAALLRRFLGRELEPLQRDRSEAGT